MPVYPFECLCGESREVWRKIKQRDDAEWCRCGVAMRRTIARPNVNPDYEPYLDEHLTPMFSSAPGTWVKSRSHRKELMKNRGVVPTG
jgi:hypothetical protein